MTSNDQILIQDFEKYETQLEFWGRCSQEQGSFFIDEKRGLLEEQGIQDRQTEATARLESLRLDIGMTVGTVIPGLALGIRN